MFQWKNLELSPEDYQNYVNNQDETQMKINNSNINAFEWSKLYQQIQVKSLGNRKLKKYILTYENNLRRLFGRDGTSKEMNGMYAKHNNELRMQLSELYDQLGLLHVRNISTTVEFTISRLLGLEEELIKIIGMKQAEIDELQAAKNSLEMGKSSQLCTSCYQEMEKNRNKFLIKQVMAVQQSACELQEIQAQQLTQPQKEEKKLKEQQKKQDHQYQIQRFYYLNSVQQVLKNREKTLKCNSAPLQTLLSQYLSQILDMLEGSKFTFTPKNLREYDRVNKSYESLDDMKALINADEFYKKVTYLIEKPYQNLIENIEKFINKSTNKSLVKTTTVQTQTLYLSQYNQIKILEKKLTEVNMEMESLRHSKNKNDIDLIGNLEALHKIEIKYMEMSNRNKILEAENKRLESHIIELKSQVVSLEETHKNDQTKIIDTNVAEKSGYIRDIKVLEARLRRYESMLEMKADKEVQTDQQNSNEIISKEFLENADKEYKKMIERRQSKKQRKRMSLKLQQIKMIRQAQANRFQAEKLDVPDVTLWKSKENLFADNNQVNNRPNERTKTIKIYTISPLQPLNDKLIHRASSRKASNVKLKESDGSKREAASIVRISSPRADIKKMKKRHESKLKHGYHSSEFANNQNHYDKRGSNASKLSAITGKKIVRQDSIKINDRSEFESQVNIQYGDQIISKEQSVQYLSGSDEGKIIVTINQPNEQTPQDQRISAWLQRQQPLLQPKQQEEINKLVKFSLMNFDALLEKNIFGMICDMKFDKNPRANIKRQEKNKDSSSVKQVNEVEPTIDVQCSKIGRRCLEIFFNMQQAEKYETKTGIWSQIDTFIMVDNNFSHFCDKVQLFFDDLKELKPMLYQQSILFLEKPYYFCQQVEGKDYQTKQITIFRESLKSFELERNWIKKLFKKLLRLHKLVHKNCHHVQKFLEIIGFNKE